MDLRSHGGRLFALHDATFSLDDAPLLPQRNVLRTVDLESQVTVGFIDGFGIQVPIGRTPDIWSRQRHARRRCLSDVPNSNRRPGVRACLVGFTC